MTDEPENSGNATRPPPESRQCPCCGLTADIPPYEVCDDCRGNGYVYGRRGVRKLGEYDS